MKVPAAFLALVGVACGPLAGPIIGDTMHDVSYMNDTGIVVRVYERVGTATTPPYAVAPGETFHNQWLVPPQRRRDDSMRRRVEATDQDGALVFCREYSYRDLDVSDWQVVVIRHDFCRS